MLEVVVKVFGVRCEVFGVRFSVSFNDKPEGDRAWKSKTPTPAG